MKKQYFRRLVLIVVVLLMGIQLCACENSESTATIVGHWQGDFRFDDYDFYHSWEYGDELYLYEDGTFRTYGDYLGDRSGTYNLLYDGQCISFNYGDCEYGPYDFSLESRDTLVIETDNDTFYLERMS